MNCRTALSCLAFLAGCTPGRRPDDPEGDERGGTWVKAFSVAGADFVPRSVATTRDGGAYQLGVIFRPGADGAAGETAIALLRVDASGDLMWEGARTFGASEGNAVLTEVAGVTESSDGSLWVAGSSAAGATVLRLGSSGEQLGRQLYGSADAPVTLSAIEATADGGFVVAGTVEGPPSRERPAGSGDLWLVRADAAGDTVVFVHDDDPSVPNRDEAHGLHVSANHQITVTGTQTGDFWVAQFTSEGDLRFTDAFSGLSELGIGEAVVEIPFVAESNTGAPGFVAVGYNAAPGAVGGWSHAPQIVYADLPAPSDTPEDDLTVWQDEDVDLGSEENEEGFGGYRLFGVALTHDPRVIVSVGNRFVSGPCPEDGSACVALEGVAVLMRRQGPPDAWRFEVERSITAAELGSAHASFTAFEPRSDGGYAILADAADGSGLLFELSDEFELDATRSVPRGRGVETTDDRGLVIWDRSTIHKLNAGGEPLWSVRFALSAPAASRPMAVVALADDNALVMANTDGGTVLLRYDDEGRLVSARSHPDLAGIDLMTIDLDGDGAPGDGALLVGTLTPRADSVSIRLDGDGTLVDTTSFGATMRLSALTRAGARIAATTERGLVWFDAGGRPGSALRFEGPTIEYAASDRPIAGVDDGGIWRLHGSRGATRLDRFDPTGAPIFSVAGLTAGDGVRLSVSGLIPRADGGVFLAGSVLSDRPDQRCGIESDCSDALLASVGADGTLLGAVSYGAARRESFAGPGAALPDNGVLLAGATTSYASPFGSVFAVRLDADGAVDSACTAGQSIALSGRRDAGRAATTWSPAPSRIDNPTAIDVEVQSPLAPVDVARSCSGESAAPVLSVAITGEGSVQSEHEGIACPGDCAQSYGTGSRVTLRATPTGAESFSAWLGDCPGGGAEIVVTMDEAMSCVAQFGGADAPSHCVEMTDCDAHCTAECGAPAGGYCEVGSGVCYCDCGTPECVPGDPRPECPQDCSTGTCAAASVSWTINGQEPEALCREGWSVRARAAGVIDERRPCLEGPLQFQVPVGLHALTLALMDEADTELNTQSLNLQVDADAAEVVAVAPFQVPGSIHITWTVNSGPNCPTDAPADTGQIQITTSGAPLEVPCSDYEATVSAPAATIYASVVLWGYTNVVSAGAAAVEMLETSELAVDIPCPCCPNPPPGTTCDR